MTNVPAGEPPRVTIAALAQATLRGISRSPFSAEAFAKLQERIEQYIDDLIIESVRIMSRHQADTVSPAYVSQASDNLVAGRRRKLLSLLGALGGALLGAAASNFLDMAKGQSVGFAQAVGAGVLGIVGAALITIQFLRE
jgi:hypothetical protein